MDLAVGRTAGGPEVADPIKGTLVADPILSLTVYVDLDGPAALLHDSVSNLGLRHFFLLRMGVNMYTICLKFV
jgi:hypothetical protein